jgi:peptidoglycan/xylan/chitin deacetylase (PgdA/CDA1 family)
MTRRRLPVALAVIIALALEVPSFLGAPAVESTGSADAPLTTEPAAPTARPITYQNIVSEVLGEPESVEDTWVNCQVTPCVALTFDDGPGPYTPVILDILDEFDARATFYPVGQQIRSWPGMLPLIQDAGHDIGNHTLSHPKLSTLSRSEQRAEITGLDTLMIDRIGFLPTSIRPPFGDIPDNDLPDPHSRPIVMWSVDSLDWRKRTSRAIVDEVLDDIGAGDIILMHELYQRSVDALPDILTELSARGLTVVSVADLLGPALFRPGLVENVPFSCPLLDGSVDVPQWCVENPQWRRAAR